VQINHRIATRTDDALWRKIAPLGLPVDHTGGIISVLNITEDDPAWPQVEAVLARHPSTVHAVDNRFTRHELDSAEWLAMFAAGHHGYPQPEDGWLESTYDLADHCPDCDIGAVQCSAFSQFLQLNWVFDEFFVRPAAHAGLTDAGASGIDFVAPVLHASGQPSRQVLQMRVSTILPPALDPVNLEAETCGCARTKYHLARRGAFRFEPAAFAGAPDVVKSREWFGSDGSAVRLVLVSQRFRQIVMRAKWRGLEFEPIHSPGT
jgi:hypothetical protein